MIEKEGVQLYPLRVKRVYAGRELVYDRNARGESWFILDLSLPARPLIPADASGLLTADGMRFCVCGRHI